MQSWILEARSVLIVVSQIRKRSVCPRRAQGGRGKAVGMAVGAWCVLLVHGLVEVFETIGVPVVRQCLKGLSTCVFAYGHTGGHKRPIARG